MASDCGDYVDDIFIDTRTGEYVGDFNAGTNAAGWPLGFTKCGWSCDSTIGGSEWAYVTNPEYGETDQATQWTPYYPCPYQRRSYDNKVGCYFPLGLTFFSYPCWNIEVVEDSSGPRALEHMPACKIEFAGNGVGGMTWIGVPGSELQGSSGGGGSYECDTSGNGLFYWRADGGLTPPCEANPGGSWLVVSTHQDGTYSMVGVGGSRNGESISCGPNPGYTDPGCSPGSVVQQRTGWHMEKNVVWRTDYWVKAVPDYLGRVAIGAQFEFVAGRWPYFFHAGQVILDGTWQFVRADFYNPGPDDVMTDCGIMYKFGGGSSGYGQNRVRLTTKPWAPLLGGGRNQPTTVYAPKGAVHLKCLHVYPRDQPVRGALPLDPIKFRVWDSPDPDAPDGVDQESTHSISEIIT